MVIPLIRFAKIKPNGKLLEKSILHGPCVRRMIVEPGDPDRDPLVAESSHEQTNDELTKKEAKQTAVTAWETWLHVQQIMKGFDIGEHEKKEKLFNEWERNQVGQNVVLNPAARAEGNGNRNNGNQIRCYNCRGVGECEEIEEVNKNCILMANLQQASTSEEQYTKLLEPITRPHQSVYQEKCLTKKINALHLSFAKTIMTLNEEIVNLNNHLSKEKSIVFYLQQEREKLKSDFKTREDELLDKLIQSEKKIKELYNILIKTGQPIQTMHMLSTKRGSFYHTKQKIAPGYFYPFYLKQTQKKQQSLYNGNVLLDKHEPPTVYDSKDILQLAQDSRLKMKQLNKEIKLANHAKINKLSKLFVSQTAKSREEVYFSNTSKTVSVSNTVSKPVSLPDDDFSDDTPSSSIVRKFLNEVKDTIMTLQRVVKSRISLNVNN
ncbi:hypothetical protein Tco_0266305 [Tanacetum coccineum]